MGIPYVTNDQLNRAAAKYDALNDPYFEVIDCQGTRFSTIYFSPSYVRGIYDLCNTSKKILLFKNYYIDDALMPANAANCQHGYDSLWKNYCHFSTPYGEFFVTERDMIYFIPNYINLNFLPEGAAFETSVLATDTRGNDLKAYKLQLDTVLGLPAMLNKCVVSICSKSQLAQVPCTLKLENLTLTLTFYAYQSDGSITIDPHDCYLAIVA